jgi:hypothetical protein
LQFNKTAEVTVLYKKYIAFLSIMFVLNVQRTFCGPPFGTDDPETVKFKHWEYYVASLNSSQFGIWSGTSPHFEVNYGLGRNLQVHLLMPVNYSYSKTLGSHFGYADTEFGIKFRFVTETENRPQIGAFPIIEIPTIKNSEFSNGKPKIYLPLWLQKSWGKLTSYGGAGYWINPGQDNNNWIFAGWEVQYDFSKFIWLGGEIYYHSADKKEGKEGTGFNIGGSINPTEKFHVIFSLGKNISGDRIFNSYIGLLWTI